MRPGQWVLCLGLVCLFAVASVGAEDRRSPALDEPTVGRYLQMLQRRPDSDYLFDRFYNEWLQYDSLAALREHLQGRVDAGGAPGDLLLLALLEQKQGDDLAALQLYNRALERSPASPDILLRRAELEMATLDFASAATDLSTAVASNPDPPLARTLRKKLGTAYLRDGRQAEALQTWDALAADAPDDQDLQEDLLELKLAEGLYDQAAADCRSLIERAPTRYKAVMLQLRLGDILQRAGRKDDSLAAYRKALEGVGADSWVQKQVLAQIERIFDADSDVTGLARYYESLRQDYPQRPEILRREAGVLMRAGQTDKALEAFAALVEATAGDVDHRRQYAAMLAEAGRTDQAIAAATRLVEENPDDAEGFIRLAGIYHQAGQSEEAGRTILQYVEKAEPSLFTFLRAGRLLESYGQTDAAGQVYHRMVQALGDSVEAVEARAAWLMRSNQQPAALAALRQLALTADAATLVRISQLLAGHRKQQEAFEILQARRDDLGDDPAFLAEMVRAAAGTERHDLAYELALVLLDRAGRMAAARAPMAEAAMALHKLDDAQARVDALKALDGRSAGRTCLLVEWLDAQGRSAEADGVMAQALAADPAGEMLCEQAYQLARRRGDYDRADAALTGLMQQHPESRASYLRERVDLCLDTGRHAEALAATHQWQQAAPTAPAAWLAEARVHSEAGRPAEAVEVLRRASYRLRDDRMILRRLSQALMADDRYDDAEQVYWRLLESAQDPAERLAVVGELAQLAEMRGRSDALIRHFESRCQTDTESVFPVLALATIHQRLYNYQEQRRYLLEAADRRSDDPDLLIQVARLERDNGDMDAAVATLERAAPLDTAGRARRELLDLLFLTGREQRGRELLAEMLAGRLADADTVERIVQTLTTAMDHDGALELLRRESSQFSGDVRLAFLRACVLEEALRPEEAVAAFLDVLDLPRENVLRDAAAAGSPLDMYGAHAAMLAGFMPPEALDIMKLQPAGMVAYQHRQTGRHGPYFPGMGGAGSGIMLPSAPQETEALVLAHLAQLSADMDEDAGDRLLAALAGRRVKHAELKLAVTRMEDGTSILEQYRRDHPDDKVVAAIWLMNGIEEGLVPEDLQTVYQLLKEDWPQLAALGAIGAIQHGGEVDEALVNEAMDLIEAQEKINDYVVLGLVYMSSEAMAQDGAVSDDLRARLRGLIVDRCGQLAANQQFGPYVFEMVMQAMTQEDDLGTLVEMLDAECRRGAAGQASAGGPYLPGMGGPAGLFEPLTFPPQWLPSVPPAVLAAHEHLATMSEAVAVHLDKATDPTLRILLLDLCGQSDEVDRRIAEMLEAPRPALGHYVLAAARAGAQDRHDDVVALLNKARHLPMRQSDRLMVESVLLTHAMKSIEAGGDGASPQQVEGTKELALQAALRLRQQRLDTEQKLQLASILEALGRSEDARQLQQATTQPGAMAAGYRGAMYHGPQTPDLDERIQTLLEKNDTGGAARLLAQTMRSLFRGTLTGLAAGQGLQNQYEYQQLRETAVANGLDDELLAELKPEDPENARLMAEYAYACDMLDLADKAVEGYRRTLQSKSDSWLAHGRLAILLSDKEPEAARTHLLEALKLRPQAVVPMVMEGFDEIEDPAVRLAICEALVNAAESLADDRKADLSWLTPLDATLADPYYRSDSQWKGLFHFGELTEEEKAAKLESNRALLLEASAASQPADRQTEADLLARRVALCRRVCDLGLYRGENAELFFTRKVNLYAFYGGDTAELVDDAERILRASAAPAPHAVRQVYSRHYYFSGMEADSSEAVSPARFFARWAVRNDGGPRFDALLADLQSPRARAVRGDLEALRQLYAAGDEAFIAVAENWLKASDGRPRRGPDETDRLGEILTVWKETRRTVSLTPLVVAQLKQTENGMWSGDPAITAGAHWVRLVYRQQGRQAGDALLNTLKDELIDPNAMAQLVRMAKSGSYTMSRRLMPAMAYFSLLENLTEVRGSMGGEAPDAAFWPAIEHLGRHTEILSGGGPFGRMSFLNHTLESQSDDPDFILASPLGGPWDQFSVVSLGENWTLLNNVVRQCSRNSWAGDRLRKALNEMPQRPFGAGLLQALMDKPTAESVFGYLGDHAATMAAGDPKRRKDLALAIRDIALDNGWDLQALQSERALAFREIFLAEVEGLDLPDPMQRLGEMDVDRDLGAYVEYAGTAISRELQRDPQRAFEMLKLAHERLGRSRSARGNPSYRDHMVRQLAAQFEDASLPLPALAELIRWAAEQPQMLQGSALHESTARQLRSHVQHRLRTLAGAQTDAEIRRAESHPDSAAIRTILTEILDTFGAMDPPGLAESFERYAWSEEELASLRGWVGEQMAAGKAVLEPLAVELDLEIHAAEHFPEVWPPKPCENCGRVHGVDYERIASLPPTFVDFMRRRLERDDLPAAVRADEYVEAVQRLSGCRDLAPLAPAAAALMFDRQDRGAPALLHDDDTVERLCALARMLADCPPGPQRDEAAAKLCQEWVPALREVRRMGMYGGDYPEEVTGAALAMVRLHLSLGQTGQALSLLNDPRMKLADTPSAYLDLLAYPALAEWLNEHLTGKGEALAVAAVADTGGWTARSMSMTPERIEAVRQVLSAIQDEPSRQVLEAVVERAQWKAPGDGENQFALTDDQRRTAERILACQDDGIRRLLLLLLPEADELDEALIAAWDTCEHERIMGMKDQRSGVYSQGFSRYVRAMLRQGRFDQFLQKRQALQARASRVDSYAAMSLRRTFDASALSLLTGQPAENMAWRRPPEELLEFGMALLAEKSPRFDGTWREHGQDLDAIAVAVHLLGCLNGQQEKADAWADSRGWRAGRIPWNDAQPREISHFEAPDLAALVASIAGAKGGQVEQQAEALAGALLSRRYLPGGRVLVEPEDDKDAADWQARVLKRYPAAEPVIRRAAELYEQRAPRPAGQADATQPAGGAGQEPQP
ncbi:MAG: tetratricopeptide repeat protein [Planctomycetes bacterium]|nr:tetratricopeptide repeat protein [Planctomycetota bacterium]